MNQQVRKEVIHCFELVKKKKPLVFHLTNLVAIEEQAHITLAIGARPIMSNSRNEAEELVDIADALLLNIGTLSSHQIQTMRSALNRAVEKKVPVLLDPVGYGASKIRNQAVGELITKGNISFIKGNGGEIAALAGKSGAVSGVDSLLGYSTELKEIVFHLAKTYSTVVAATGEIDCISDGNQGVLLIGGSPLLTCISGSGCMAGSLIASFMATGTSPFIAGITGILTMKIAAQKAAKQVDGPGTFANILIDEIFKLTSEDLEQYGEIQWI
jgi:hydroxyethylthiazole kinase